MRNTSSPSTSPRSQRSSSVLVLDNEPICSPLSLQPLNRQHALAQHSPRPVQEWTPLQKSIVCEDIETMSRLLRDGANPNERTSRGNTPLHLACMEGLFSFADLLIDRGACVNARNVDNETPLHFAVRSGSLDVITMLLLCGASPEPLDSNFQTPLHWALADNNSLAAELLIHHASPADSCSEFFSEGDFEDYEDVGEDEDEDEDDDDQDGSYFARRPSRSDDNRYDGDNERDVNDADDDDEEEDDGSWSTYSYHAINALNQFR